MDDNIEWKEARGGQIQDDDDHYSDEPDDSQPYNDSSISEEECEGEDGWKSDSSVTREEPLSKQKFAFEFLDLKLSRNITSLSDQSKYQTRDSANHLEPVFKGIENGLIAMTPNAEMILFSCDSPEKVTFLAKLRKEPSTQYTMKNLEIPLDYDEQITAILCLPIMSGQKTAVGIVDWIALVVGLSSGYVRFYTEQSICLLSLKFFESPVLSIKFQSQKNFPFGRSESHFATLIDELAIVSKSSTVVLDGIGLYENLKIANEESARNGSNYEPAYDINSLPMILNCQKWKSPTFHGSSVSDVELLGTRVTSKFDSLKSKSINFEYISSKAYAKTLTFVGQNPVITCHKEPKDTQSHSVTEMISSLIPFWSKPAVTKLQMNEIPGTCNISFFDKDRSLTSVTPSPDRRLLATTDSFGRVMLVDVTNWLVIRIWKGYRSAQCGWFEVRRTPEDKKSPYATFLVIYAPKRGILEIWSCQRGPRVAAFNVGKSCRLLYCCHGMINARAEILARGATASNLMIDQMYSSNCYLLNIRNETIFSIQLPYTYSLYKYGDLKSRDFLLVSEISNALQQDCETEFISEILHRISSAESLEISIQKIALALTPDKVSRIIQNLVTKLMAGYFESGEIMSNDDYSIVELCKRLVRLCSIFEQLSQSKPSDLYLPEVNERLIESYDEHPQEIDEFAQQLGWNANEILRFLSLLALQKSYTDKSDQINPWPSLGEPLTWQEFVSCFNLSRIDSRSIKKNPVASTIDKVTIRLLKTEPKFLTEDRVIKTALFLYSKASDNYYKSLSTTSNKGESTVDPCADHNFLEPSTRLLLLFEFWLSTKLCDHWKMWAFLQNQVNQVSDELKALAVEHNDEQIQIETWKQIYNLILESDNLYAGLVATAAIRRDTIRSISSDKALKDKGVERESDVEEDEEEDEEDFKSSSSSARKSSAEWECLFIDAERISLLGKQLEDVFLLDLLLRYSPSEGRLVEHHVYRVARISVANILRAGPSVVSQLVAEWSIQSKLNLSILTKDYGCNEDSEMEKSMPDFALTSKEHIAVGSRFYRFKKLNQQESNDDHAMELLHHTKTAFPRSLDSDKVIVHLIWELCSLWTTNRSYVMVDKSGLIGQVMSCLPMLSCEFLHHKLATLAYRTYFQRTFEHLVALVETNSTILLGKNLRSRDAFARKELNVEGDSLDQFVQFCCDLSDLMLHSHRETLNYDQETRMDLEQRLIETDDWWSTPSAVKILRDSCSHISSAVAGSLTARLLSNSESLSVDSIVELNRLANLMNLIFKLKLNKVYPLTLIGQQSRRALNLEEPNGDPIRSTSVAANVSELRQRFIRKCILAIVEKLCQSSCEFAELETDDHDEASQRSRRYEAIDSVGGQQRDLIKKKTKPKQQVQLELKTQQTDTISISGSCSRRQTSRTAELATDSDDDYGDAATVLFTRDENNESMVMFGSLLSLATEWEMNSDELHLELVFELYRCNRDKMAAQISTRVRDQQTLASGLLKICSQRVLVLFGLSPQVSGSQWRQRTDRWSAFQPNVASWLRSIQQEELRQTLAGLVFAESLRSEEDSESEFGLQSFVLHALRDRTKLVLENVTNHLEGQASRLAYDLLQLLEGEQTKRILALANSNRVVDD